MIVSSKKSLRNMMLSICFKFFSYRSSIQSSVANDNDSFATKHQRPPTIATCHSLTQHPLADATDTLTAGNQASYGLYYTHNTLTQYPLGDTELNTVLENPAEEEEEDVQEKQTKSSASEVSAFRNNQSRGKNSKSIESELELKETPIETFESPEKHVKELIENKDDIFYTPAKGVTIGLEDVSSARSKDGKSSISLSSKDGGSMKETDLRTDSISEASVKSYSNNDKVVKIEEELEENEKEKREEEKAEENDMMAKYMQMVMQKKQNEKEDEKVVETKDEVRAMMNIIIHSLGWKI